MRLAHTAGLQASEINGAILAGKKLPFLFFGALKPLGLSRQRRSETKEVRMVVGASPPLRSHM
jgi:hypothetical protein